MPDGLAGRLWHMVWDDPELGIWVKGLSGFIVVVVVITILCARAAGRSRRVKEEDEKLPAKGGHFLWGLFTRHSHRVRMGGLVNRVIFDVAWRHIAILGTSGSRKALALDTPLATPDGWTTMGEIRVGDVVFDERGQPSRVIGVSPVQIGNPCYEVEFSDGSTIVADAEHLWLTESYAARASASRVRRLGPTRLRVPGDHRDQRAKLLGPALVTTEEIARTLYSRWGRGRRALNHAIRVADALALPAQALPVDPYVLGAWLGDTAGARFTCNASDSQIVDEIRGCGISMEQVARQKGAFLYQMGVAGKRFGRTDLSLQAKLRCLGVLGDKHIPESYLRGSCEQRLALLQGLMDTDGDVTTNGEARFWTTNPRLAQDVLHLVSSLGIKPNLHGRPCRGRRLDTSTIYGVAFTTDLPVARLERKRARLPQHLRRTQQLRYVRAVRAVPSVPVRCIAVDAPSHLYLAGRTLIPTHNSTLMAELIERIGKPFIVIAGDHAPPLLNLTLSLGYKVWQARGKLVAWYPWGGDLEKAVQRVEFMFPASGGDVGVHRSMFKLASRLAWAETPPDFERTLQKRIRDEAQREMVRAAAVQIGVGERDRDVDQIIALLPVLATGSSGKTMAENWIPRLQDLVESMGDSIKTASQGGVDVVDEAKAGRGMMFALNSFADVSNRERFATIAALEQLRAADEVGGLTLAYDEIGLLGAELFAEAVRVFRVRLCTGLFASHVVEDFPKLLRGLIKVWFIGELPEDADRQWASKKLYGTVPAAHFGEHVLSEGEFYLSANGRIQHLRVPTWVTRPVPAVEPEPVPRMVVAPGLVPSGTAPVGTMGGRSSVSQVPGAEAPPRVTAGRKLSPWPAFNVSDAWLDVWDMLGQPTSPDELWLVPEQKVQSGGRAWFWHPEFRKKIGAREVYEHFGSPNGPLAKLPAGRKTFPANAKSQLHHGCHQRDETCPGGKCIHLRCLNPFCKIPVTVGENIRLKALQTNAYQQWLMRQPLLRRQQLKVV